MAAAFDTVEVEELRVFAASDLHVDNPSNMQYVTEMPDAQDGDVMLLAGDLHHELGPLETALRRLAGKGYEVVWIWGNHDIWLSDAEKEAGRTSFDKIADVEAMCARVGVRTRPTRFVTEDRSVWVVPLRGWYETAFDVEPQSEGQTGMHESFLNRWQDFSRCVWPPELEGEGADRGTGLCELFSQQNREALPDMQLPGKAANDLVISMSHFVPRVEAIPERRYMMEGDLFKVSGSRALTRDVYDLHAGHPEELSVHLFGHTHIPWDSVVDGVRLLQWPMGYPRERHRTFIKAGKYQPLMVFDASKARRKQVAPIQPTKWGNYYAENARDPDNVEPAEWVVNYNAQKALAEGSGAAGASDGPGGVADLCGCVAGGVPSPSR